MRSVPLSEAGRAVRWAVAAGTAILAAGLVAAPAAAAPSPGPASISSVRVSNGVFTGVLTVRANQSSVAVDPASLQASVGSKKYPVTVKPRGTGEARHHARRRHEWVHG